MTDLPEPSRFSHVTDWVFDLDNTLYPHHSNLFSQIDVKMTSYVSELLTLPREEARKLQKELYREYGTTLAGLMQQHGIDSDDFLQKVHDIDYSWLVPDPVLGAAIRQLPGRKFIFTNGNRKHAERTARQLGILDDFDDIFDIVAAGLTPKPARQTYERFANLYAITGPNAVMFEDLARNLSVPKSLGMTTVLIVPKNFEPTFAEIWERDKEYEDDVDFVTDDLAALPRRDRPGCRLRRFTSVEQRIASLDLSRTGRGLDAGCHPEARRLVPPDDHLIRAGDAGASPAAARKRNRLGSGLAAAALDVRA